MKQQLLSEAEVRLLEQALVLAQRKKLDYARELNRCADAGGNGLITPEAARIFAQEHQTTVEEFATLLQKLNSAVNLLIETEEPN